MMATDEATRRADTEAADALIEKCGYAAAAVTLLPLPGSEVLAVMPIHVGMVVRIGHVYGVDVDRDTATHLILRIGATVGLSLIGSRVATTAAKLFLPGLGGLIGAPFMYASTLAIGRVAQLYFERGDLTDGQIREIYRDTVARARRTFDPRKARSSEARSMAEEAAAEAQEQPGAAAAAPGEEALARLERLKRLLDEGLIDRAEFDQAKRRILGEL